MPQLVPLTDPVSEEVTEPSVVRHFFALKDGDTFLVADASGDVLGESDGLFRNDTRVLSGFRLTLGGVSLHYLAGFGGGPKMVFPGVASRAGAAANHKRALGPLPPGGLHPGCGPGRIEGNPVAEDIAQAAAVDPAQVSLHVVKKNEYRVASVARVSLCRCRVLEIGNTPE